MSRVIRWRTLKGMKKQHLARYTYNGDIIFHCMAYTKNPISTSGYSANVIDEKFLIKNKDLPKCKKCLKEEKRINLITNRLT